MGEMRNSYKILVGKPEEKTPLGRPKHRGEVLKEIRCGLDSTDLG
jgi:hypothetical protein